MLNEKLRSTVETGYNAKALYGGDTKTEWADGCVSRNRSSILWKDPWELDRLIPTREGWLSGGL